VGVNDAAPSKRKRIRIGMKYGMRVPKSPQSIAPRSTRCAFSARLNERFHV